MFVAGLFSQIASPCTGAASKSLLEPFLHLFLPFCAGGCQEIDSHTLSSKPCTEAGNIERGKERRTLLCNRGALDLASPRSAAAEKRSIINHGED